MVKTKKVTRNLNGGVIAGCTFDMSIGALDGARFSKSELYKSIKESKIISPDSMKNYLVNNISTYCTSNNLKLCSRIFECFQRPDDILKLLYQLNNELILQEINSNANNNNTAEISTKKNENNDENNNDNTNENNNNNEKSKKKTKKKKKSKEAKEDLLANFVFFFNNIFLKVIEDYLAKELTENASTFTLKKYGGLISLSSKMKRYLNIENPSSNIFFIAEGNRLLRNPFFEETTLSDASQSSLYTAIKENRDYVLSEYDRKMQSNDDNFYREQLLDDETNSIGSASLFGGLVIGFIGFAGYLQLTSFKPLPKED